MNNFEKIENELQTKMDNLIFHVIVKILLWKQARYGRKNIEQFGVRGLTLRMNDKMQRMINKAWNQETTDNVWHTRESLAEDVFDMIGYCLILLIQHYGYLDLFEEVAKQSFKQNEKEPIPYLTVNKDLSL